MLQITEGVRDQISNYLKNAIVPAITGANLIQIANALDGLAKIDAAPVKAEEVVNDGQP